MIVVSVREDGINIRGHANFAEIRKDIVCAGVSALTQTLVKSIKDLTDDKIQYEVSPGRADIYYKNLSEAGRYLVDSFFVGICLITEQYPDHVDIR